MRQASAARVRRAAYNERMLTSDRCRLLPLVIAFATLAGACQSGPAAPPAAPPVSPDVWAVVDGREIRRDDVDKAYRRTVQPAPGVSDDEALASKLSILDQMIVEDIMNAKAKELNIQVPESEVDAAFNQGKENIPDEAFNKELAARNLTAADMRDGLRRDLIARKVIEHEVSSKITVTDQDINDFFQANKAQFNLAEDAYHIAQIVVTNVKEPQITNRTGDDAATPQAAAAKAQMLMERLKSGTPFNELAADFSEDAQSAPRGGDVGLVPVSALRQIPPPLRDAVTKSQPGTVNIVPMEGGYTIVALVAKQAAGQRDTSMPEVRDGITQTLKGRREQLLRAAYIEAMREKAAVVNHLARRIVDAQGKVPPTLSMNPPK
jgi:peptidyl-prolyl cis-trans isomerase SurA